MSTVEIPTSADFNVIQFLSDPTTIREWNIQGLPADNFSTENGIIVTSGSRWPLVIDPQCQAQKWIKAMEGKNDLQVSFSISEPFSVLTNLPRLLILECRISCRWWKKLFNSDSPYFCRTFQRKLIPPLIPFWLKQLSDKEDKTWSKYSLHFYFIKFFKSLSELAWRQVSFLRW